MFAKFFTNQNLINLCKLVVTNVVDVVIKTISVAFIIPLLNDSLKNLNSKFM